MQRLAGRFRPFGTSGAAFIAHIGALAINNRD
jgi:hypothetical protein